MFERRTENGGGEEEMFPYYDDELKTNQRFFCPSCTLFVMVIYTTLIRCPPRLARAINEILRMPLHKSLAPKPQANLYVVSRPRLWTKSSDRTPHLLYK